MIKNRFAAGALLAAGLTLASSAGWSQQAPAVAAATKPAPSGPIVRVSTGQIQGVQNVDVVAFRGIPFAAPPVGPLRWKAPQPAAKWTGVRETTAPSAACNQNEDCLYLNVHMPADARPGQKLPVMVWIHGGSFTSGSGAIYDGTTFAKRGLVVVTVNYRLGRMGFFAHPALTKEAGGAPVGNYGFLDQIAALKWVQNNATAFGGDPKNVTVFGESAGAISVNYLMISPLTHGLFSKAISESGFARYAAPTLKEYEASGAALAAKINITGDGAATAAALRALPMNGLPRAGAGYTDPGRPGPVIDGKIVTTSINDGFARGLQAKVPFMIGGNSNEASLLPTPNPAEALAAVKTRREAFLAAYDPDKKNDATRIMNSMVTVQNITEPDRYVARAHTKTGQPTFLYYFSYVPAAQRATSPGSAHAAEIPYVFNMMAQGRPGDDISTAQSMNAYWAAFAKYGNPAQAGGPLWSRYDLTREPSIEFASDGVKIHEHFQAAKLDWAEQGLGTQ